MVEIYDEDTLTEFELNRQRNIIKNFEFMKACGLPVKPLIYVKRVHVPLEEQFKYLSDESSDSSDEEWTLGPKKKKKGNKNEPKSADIRIKVSNPTEFFKQKKKREEEEKNGIKKTEEDNSKKQETEKKRRKRKSKKNQEDDAQPSTSGTSTLSASSKSSTSGNSASSKSSTSGNSASSSTGPLRTEQIANEKKSSAHQVSSSVSSTTQKANGKQFIKERPKLPPSTLKSNRILDTSSSDEDKDEEEDDTDTRDIQLEPVRSRYPKREGQPRIDYSEAEVPDDDHYLFCAECNLYYQGECAKHLPITPISDSTTTPGSLKARASLPEGMEIRKSGIKDAGLGVFSTMPFKSGTTFGPYAGEKVRADVPKVGLDTSYMWEIVKDLKVVYYINGKNEEFANWMRYVNCSRNEEEQNMIAYQFHGKIFYRVYKDVEAGTEFLVWYGAEYAGELGIALEEKPVKIPVGKFITFKCDWCLICYAYEEALTKHKKFCSKKPIESSAVVNGEVSSQPADESHSDSGSGSTKGGVCHQCHICGKVFASNANLKKHLLVHTREQPFSCKQCGKKFSEKGSLTRHQRVHSGEQAYSCDVCGKKFSENSNLTRHMLIHTSDKPFICEVCGHQSTTAQDMRGHMRVHTGETPYKCQVCGKGFKESHHLKVHSRTHTGETPYKCVVCGKGFKSSGDLKKHSRTHTGEKPYECPHCEYKCSAAGNFKKHLKSKHPSDDKEC